MKAVIPLIGIIIAGLIFIGRAVWLALEALEAYDHHNPD